MGEWKENIKMKLFTFSIGQFGTVYKGILKGSSTAGAGVIVAIKTIKNYNSKETENFLREMSIMSKLNHPNIVRFYGLVQKGILYQ